MKMYTECEATNNEGKKSICVLTLMAQLGIDHAQWPADLPPLPNINLDTK